MTIPTRPVAVTCEFQSLVPYAQMIEVTLQDGAILWIPRDKRNRDYGELLQWAQRNHISIV